MMLKKKSARYGVALAAATALCLGFGALPAQADPDPGTYPTLAGAGSDTVQDVLNGLASVIPAIGSYDATNPATGVPEGTIQTRSTGSTFDRPNGSGDGVKALSYSVDGIANNWDKTGAAWPGGPVNIEGYIDFARSSSGPQSTSDLTRALSYLPFAQDAVTYAFNGASDFPRNLQFGSAADAASKVTLYNIYNCRSTTNGGKYSYVDKDLNSVLINPLVPQSGSGTRNFWSGALAGNTAGTFASCVTDRAGAVQEHNGTALTGAGDIAPYSIAQFIAQGNHAAIATSLDVSLAERRGLAQLGVVGGLKPTTYSGGNAVMNAGFDTRLQRLVYIVVPTSRLNPGDTSAVAVATRAAFSGNSSAVCQADEVIAQFGFANVGALCGTVYGTSNFTA